MKPIREQFSKGQPGKADPAKGLCAYLVHGLRTNGTVSGLRIVRPGGGRCWGLGTEVSAYCVFTGVAYS